MIEVNNLTTKQINEKFFKKVSEFILKREKKRLELSIVLVGGKKIRELNKKYRKKNRLTDVLAFSYNHSGEIVICLEQVRKNATRFNSNYKKELTQVLIHGILHLLGYDHEKSQKKAELMERKQNYYLKLCQKII